MNDFHDCNDRNIKYGKNESTDTRDSRNICNNDSTGKSDNADLAFQTQS